MEVANIINTYLSIVSNICILGITIYTTVKTFWYESIEFLGYSYSSNIFYGFKATIQIRNQSLSSISIKNIYILCEDNSYYPFKTYEIPLLVEARRSIQISMEPIAKDIKALWPLKEHSKALLVEFTDGTSIAVLKGRGRIYRIKHWIKNFREYRKLKKHPALYLSEKYSQLTRTIIKYDDTFLSSNVKFILVYNNGSGKEVIYITDKGFMSRGLFNGTCFINGVDASSYEVLERQLKCIFENYTDHDFKLFASEYVTSVTTNEIEEMLKRA